MATVQRMTVRIFDLLPLKQWRGSAFLHFLRYCYFGGMHLVIPLTRLSVFFRIFYSDLIFNCLKLIYTPHGLNKANKYNLTKTTRYVRCSQLTYRNFGECCLQGGERRGMWIVVSIQYQPNLVQNPEYQTKFFPNRNKQNKQRSEIFN